MVNTTMTVNRSIPSRDLDAEVARALGWTDVSYGPVYWMKQSDWRGFPPHETMMIAAVPAYTTAPRWDSTHWGEMMAWLIDHSACDDVTIRAYLSMDDVIVYWAWIDTEPDGQAEWNGVSGGHALARAVLAVADWRMETSNEQPR